MKLFTIFSFLIFSVNLLAESPQKNPNRIFKAAIVSGKENIQELKKSLATQATLKNSALKIKFGKNKNEEQLKQFEEQHAKLEAYHSKKYGMIPGMTYQLMNEKASVSLLLSDEQLNKISDNKTIAEKAAGTQGKLKKYPQFELTSSKAIQEFIMAANQGRFLTDKIEELKKSRQAKEIADQKKIIEQLKKLEEQKDKFDAAMNKKYGIKSKLDYMLDITAVSLYLVLSENDLKEIAAKNQKQFENEFRKKLNAQK